MRPDHTHKRGVDDVLVFIEFDLLSALKMVREAIINRDYDRAQNILSKVEDAVK